MLPVTVAKTIELAVPVGKKAKEEELRWAPMASAVTLEVIVLKVGNGATPGQTR